MRMAGARLAVRDLLRQNNNAPERARAQNQSAARILIAKSRKHDIRARPIVIYILDIVSDRIHKLKQLLK